MAMSLAEFLSRMCLAHYKKTSKEIYNLVLLEAKLHQKTFVYARLFQKGAFIPLLTKNNPEFAAACAAIAFNAREDHEIWNIRQFQQLTDKIEDACKFAYVFRKVYMEDRMSNVKQVDSSAALLAQRYASVSREYGRASRKHSTDRNSPSPQPETRNSSRVEMRDHSEDKGSSDDDIAEI